MSEDNFIARWSRRKREAEGEKRPAVAPGREPHEARDAQPSAEPGKLPAASEPAFDPATLPPVDSIVAGSDIRAFLQKNVPAELTRAALRRAWTTDPAIRDFIGIAENQWDFTDPASIPGFGTLEAGADLQGLLAQATGKLAQAEQTIGLAAESKRQPSSADAAEPRRSHETPAETATAPPEQKSNDAQRPLTPGAVQHPGPVPDTAAMRRRRGHGSAVPQ